VAALSWPGAGEDGQQLEVGCGAVTADEVVQGDTGRKVFQHEEPGRYVGGDNARGKRESQIVGQEPQHSRDSPGLKTIPALDGDGCTEKIRQEGLHHGGMAVRSGGRHQHKI
jgi:hypothetical protein